MPFGMLWDGVLKNKKLIVSNKINGFGSLNCFDNKLTLVIIKWK